MKNEIIRSFSGNFDDHSQTTDISIEFLIALDLQNLSEYSDWRNFNQVIIKAKYLAKSVTANHQTISLTPTKWSF